MLGRSLRGISAFYSPSPTKPLRIIILRLATLAGPSPPAEQPPSLHQILRDHGFTDRHIAALLQRAPWLLTFRSLPLVSSRLHFLSDHLRLFPRDLAKIVTSDPGVLRSSLERTLAPSLSFLRSFLASQDLVARAVVHAPWLIRPAHSTVAQNIAAMQSSGVPDHSISQLLLTQPRTLIRNPASFRRTLDAVLLAGFAPSDKMFVYAIHTKSAMSGPTWERKVRVYLASGWTPEQVQIAFRRWPCIFAYSEERIKKHLDFHMNVLKLRVAEFLPYVKLMSFSLEETLIPRCCVLNILITKGLVKKKMNVLLALCKSNANFLENFVDKYKHVDPRVLEAHQGKMQFLGFDFKKEK